MAATHGWIALLRVAAEIAGLLGEQGRRQEIQREAEDSATAFARAFGTADGSEWGSGSQASLALALDLNVVPLVKELSHLPIIVDPSHGTGRRSLVGSMSLAALAAGADGLIIEVHPDPDRA